MYQLKHNHLGIFQGVYNNSLFWLNYSLSPFVGICQFGSIAEIDSLLLILCSRGFSKDDFQIEIFDVELDEKLRTQSVPFIMGNC